MLPVGVDIMQRVILRRHRRGGVHGAILERDGISRLLV